MRTTLAIDDDVLNAARAIALHQDRTIGEVVSDLARQALEKRPSTVRFRNGVPLLPDRPGPLVTIEDVNALRDELP
ncbi:CopG family transcriptional regulator [Brevundimonas sp. SORGH_AS_0993]|uniref:CopG family transcriptional regulator n=1 Tax=Brevundimonas sp. SORGH_AS_0993 TaxID=3041794 RepID=UPI0027D784B9|nr:CopG family transcriptional regulator [Brevundimonas sp. SORGH_AS_0993]